MSQTSRRQYLLGCMLALCLASPLTPLTTAAQVQTQAQVSASAEEWFRIGKARLAHRDYDGACNALSESVGLERASGALLALALCHERQERLATSFAEYVEVASRSQTEQRRDRQLAARKKADAIETRLSTLRIGTTNTGSSELSVTINGVPVRQAQLDTDVPVDGGQFLVEANAPGRKPWSTQIVIAASNERRVLDIPTLDPLPLSAAEVASPRVELTPPRAKPAPRKDDGLNATQWAGVGTMGAGVAAALAGGVLVMHAVGKNNASKLKCVEDLCSVDGRRDRLYARDAGNAATIAFIAAGGLAAAGFVLYLSGNWASSDEERSQRGLSGSIWAAPGAGGASIRGSF